VTAAYQAHIFWGRNLALKNRPYMVGTSKKKKVPEMVIDIPMGLPWLLLNTLGAQLSFFLWL
jgi:hypothetical protein